MPRRASRPGGGRREAAPSRTFGSGRGDLLSLAATGDAATESGQGEHASPDQDPDARVRSAAADHRRRRYHRWRRTWGRRGPVPIVDGLELRAVSSVRVRTRLRRRHVRERGSGTAVVLVDAVPERHLVALQGAGDDLELDVDDVVGEPAAVRVTRVVPAEHAEAVRRGGRRTTQVDLQRVGRVLAGRAGERIEARDALEQRLDDVRAVLLRSVDRPGRAC